MGAEGEELGKGADGLDVTERGDADEPVRVEVVAEEDARVAVVGAEEPRPAVVEEIALVDRLEPDGEALLRERREDRLCSSRSGSGRSAAAQSSLSRPASTAIVSQSEGR